MNTEKEIRKVTIVGSIGNILLAGLKISVGFFSKSQALIADGIHSLSDLITDVVILIGVREWTRPADKEHPYGHGRIETLTNIFIGIVLAGVAFVLGRNALLSFTKETPRVLGWPAFGAAIISIIVKEILFRLTVKKGKEINSRALISNAWHHRSDALSSLPVALAVLLGKLFPSIPFIDPIAALFVTLFLIKASWHIILPCLKELLESREDTTLENSIEALRHEIKEIEEIHKIRIRRIGSALLLDLHMLVDRGMTIEQAHIISWKLENKIQEIDGNISDILIHIEPYIAKEKNDNTDNGV